MKKKIVIVMATLMLLLASVPSKAQVFIQDEEFEGRGRVVYEDFGLTVPHQGVDPDQYLPVGDGWLLLAAFGGAYLVKKARKKER